MGNGLPLPEQGPRNGASTRPSGSCRLWKGCAVPEAVAEHIHDLQQRLHTQVPGEVIKLQQNKEGFQTGGAKLQQPQKNNCGALAPAASQQSEERELGQGCSSVGSCPPGAVESNGATAAGLRPHFRAASLRCSGGWSSICSPPGSPWAALTRRWLCASPRPHLQLGGAGSKHRQLDWPRGRQQRRCRLLGRADGATPLSRSWPAGLH